MLIVQIGIIMKHKQQIRSMVEQVNGLMHKQVMAVFMYGYQDMRIELYILIHKIVKINIEMEN